MRLPFSVSVIIIALSLLLPAGAKVWHGNLPQQQVYADQIREFIPPGERVYMYPINSGYYYLTNRLPSSKYAYISHLVAGAMTRYPMFREQISEDLMRSPYIVVWKQHLKMQGELVNDLAAQSTSHRPMLLDTTQFTLYGPSQ